MDIILYLSNGYPTMESSIQMAREYVDAGCRIIEVDFPSRDPYLESDLIKSRMAKALENCDDYDAYMEEILTIKRQNLHTKLLIAREVLAIREPMGDLTGAKIDVSAGTNAHYIPANLPTPTPVPTATPTIDPSATPNR